MWRLAWRWSKTYKTSCSVNTAGCFLIFNASGRNCVKDKHIRNTERSSKTEPIISIKFKHNIIIDVSKWLTPIMDSYTLYKEFKKKPLKCNGGSEPSSQCPLLMNTVYIMIRYPCPLTTKSVRILTKHPFWTPKPKILDPRQNWYIV